MGYKDTDQTIRKNIDDEDKKIGEQILRPVLQTGLTYNEKNTIYINESGLYSLILSSKLPEAKKFKRWITSEVLPSIRKQGEYILRNKNKELEKENNLLKQENEQYKICNNKIKQTPIFIRKKGGYLYVASNKSYKREGIFKIGFSKNPIKRMNSLNTSHVKDNEMQVLFSIKSYNAPLLEREIHFYLKHYKYDKEFYHIPYERLIFIIEEVNNTIHSIIKKINTTTGEFNLDKINDRVIWFNEY